MKRFFNWKWSMPVLFLTGFIMLALWATSCNDRGSSRDLFVPGTIDGPCACNPAVADTCYVIPPGHRDTPSDSLSCTPWPPGQK